MALGRFREGTIQLTQEAGPDFANHQASTPVGDGGWHMYIPAREKFNY